MGKVLESFLAEHESVLFLRLHWVDLSGVLHTRIVPKPHALRLESHESSYSVGPPCMISTLSNTLLDNNPITHAVNLQPDWMSLRHCTFAPKHASVMCYTNSAEAENPSSLCTRKLLRDVLNKSEEEQGRRFLIGSEIEFVLLGPDSQVRNTHDAVEGWSQTAGLRGEVLTLIEDIVESLIASGVGIWHFHTELAQQLEISLEPLPPVEALDALYYAIETIKTFAIARGMRATIAPKPLLDGTINGMHLHMSMNPKDDKDHFLAGILGHLQSLLIFGVANYDGYARVGNTSMDNFGSWVSCGTANGEVPIGIVEEAHWELRFVDSTANYYLLLAAAISLGLIGIREQRPLIWRDLHKSPEDLSKEQLSELGITQPLPRNLKEGIDFLREESVIGSIVGREIKDFYVRIKEKDCLAFEKMSDEDRRQWFTRFF